jgi:hypothetical protein
MSNLTKQQIISVEQKLGKSLPKDVFAKYLEFNGFRGPTECQFLYTIELEKETDLLRVNSLIHNEDWFPSELESLLLIGDDGSGSFIAFDTIKEVAVLWHPEDGTEIQETRNTISEMWEYVEGLYENEA